MKTKQIVLQALGGLLQGETRIIPQDQKEVVYHYPVDSFSAWKLDLTAPSKPVTYRMARFTGNGIFRNVNGQWCEVFELESL